MKPSKPVSFPSLPRRWFVLKFGTNGNVCLDVQFVLDTVGVAPLPCRLWFLSYPDTMNQRSSAHLVWAVCYDFTNPETLNNTVIDKPGSTVPLVYDLGWLIFYSPAPKFSSLIGLGAVALADYSHRWAGVYWSGFQKVKGKVDGIASSATTRQNMQYNEQNGLHFLLQAVSLAVSVPGWGGWWWGLGGCWLQNCPGSCELHCSLTWSRPEGKQPTTTCVWYYYNYIIIIISVPLIWRDSRGNKIMQ